MKKINETIKSVPILNALVVNAKFLFSKNNYIQDSKKYWVTRYEEGGNSGAGSYNKFAEFKAEVLNDFVDQNQILKVVEFGCGDGNQLKYYDFPEYIGYDVSPDALTWCRKKFKNDATKSFKLIEEFQLEEADLSLSIDVVYHLIEDQRFEQYMAALFEASTKFVIIYSSNSPKYNLNTAPHVKHRKFSKWVTANKPNFKLVQVVKNKYPYRGNYLEGSSADFFIYQKMNIL